MVGDVLVLEEGDAELDPESRAGPWADISSAVEFPPAVKKSSSAVEKCCSAEISKAKSDPRGDVWDGKWSESN